MSKACPASRYVETIEKSKCRKDPETSKTRERLVNILIKSAQFKVVANFTKKENIDIFTNFLMLEAHHIENIYQET